MVHAIKPYLATNDSGVSRLGEVPEDGRTEPLIDDFSHQSARSIRLTSLFVVREKVMVVGTLLNDDENQKLHPTTSGTIGSYDSTEISTLKPGAAPPIRAGRGVVIRARGLGPRASLILAG